MQETRRWEDDAGITDSMRTKEDAHDYRYFPDPDLMPHRPSDEWLSAVREEVVELPLDRKMRMMSQYKIPHESADVLVREPLLGDYFEQAVKGIKNSKSVANWVTNNLQAKLAESETTIDDLLFSPAAIGELVELVENGKISGKIAQEVFNEMFRSGVSPLNIVESRGLSQVSDTVQLEAFCEEVVRANPDSVDDFRDGKEAALNFLKGQVMKISRGQANPKMVDDLLRKMLAD